MQTRNQKNRKFVFSFFLRNSQIPYTFDGETVKKRAREREIAFMKRNGVQYRTTKYIQCELCCILLLFAVTKVKTIQ